MCVRERASKLNETRFAIEAMLLVVVVVVIIVGPFAQPTWLLRVILSVPTINIFFKCFFSHFGFVTRHLTAFMSRHFCQSIVCSFVLAHTFTCWQLTVEAETLVVMVLIVLCNCYVPNTSSILFNLTIFLFSLCHSTSSLCKSAKFFDDVQNVATPNWIFHHFCSN